MNEKARRCIVMARTRLLRRHPFFSAVALALRPAERIGMGTLSVSRRLTLYYDPGVVLEWGVAGTAAVVLHEALHCLHGHAARARGRDHVRWNVACDIAINQGIIEEAGWTLPGTPLRPETFGFPRLLCAEEYYAMLRSRMDIGRGAGPGMGTCGGCCGNPHPIERDIDEGAPLDGAFDGFGSPSHLAVLRRETAKAIAACTDRMGRESIPGEWSHWAEGRLRAPKVDWRARLSRLVRGAVLDAPGSWDFSYRRPSRRLAALRLAFGARTPLLPALRAPRPEIAIVVDTSGSMMHRLDRACSETLSMIRALGAAAMVYSVDADVRGQARVSSARGLRRLETGGGGTDMRVGVAAAAQGNPDAILVVTDGITEWPAENQLPRARLIAVVLGSAEVPGHIRHVVRIEDDDEEDL